MFAPPRYDEIMPVLDIAWLILSGLVAIGGCVIAIRGLFADRSRGRRRCPKCWYELTGLEGTRRCPECGRIAKSERSLRRTRRHWIASIAGAFLVAVGLTAIGARQVHRHGWIGAVPTIGYIAALPAIDFDSEAFEEIRRRIAAGPMREFEYRLFVGRVLGVLEDEDASTDRLMEGLWLLERMQSMASSRGGRDSWLRRPSPSEIDRERLFSVLSELLVHDDSGVRARAFGTFRGVPGPTGELTPYVFAALLKRKAPFYQWGQLNQRGFRIEPGDLVLSAPSGRSPRSGAPSETVEFAERIAACRDDLDSARAISQETLAAGPRIPPDSVEPAILALWTLLQIAPDDPETHELFLRFASRDFIEAGSERGVHIAAIRGLMVLPWSDRLEAVLGREIREGDRWGRDAAVNVVYVRWREAKELLPDLEALLRKDDLHALEAMAHARIVGDAELAVTHVLRALEHDGIPAHPTEPPITSTLQVLSEIGKSGQDERAMRLADQHLDHEDSRTRTYAVTSYALHGGDTERATRILLPELRKVSRGNVAPMAARELAREDALSVPVLVEELETGRGNVRVVVSRLLQTMGREAEAALPTLRKLRDDPVSQVAYAADEAVRFIQWEVEHPEWTPPWQE